MKEVRFNDAANMMVQLIVRATDGSEDMADCIRSMDFVDVLKLASTAVPAWHWQVPVYRNREYLLSALRGEATVVLNMCLDNRLELLCEWLDIPLNDEKLEMQFGRGLVSLKDAVLKLISDTDL